MIKSLVSIVMPTFNCRDFLSESINSVIKQTYHNWELIIVDDCSTDDSANIAQKHVLQDSRIHFFSMEKNSGPAFTRNKAIEKSRGQYIAFLDSDDIWVSQKLEIQIAKMQENKALFCFSSYTPFRADRRLLPAIQAPETVTYRRMLRGSVIGCLTVVYDASVIGKRYFFDGKDVILGAFYSRIIRRLGHEDYALWLKILKDFDSNLFSNNAVLGIDESLAYYRLRENSFSANKKKVMLYTWIIYRRCENFGITKSTFYLASHVINWLLKRKLNIRIG